MARILCQTKLYLSPTKLVGDIAQLHKPLVPYGLKRNYTSVKEFKHEFVLANAFECTLDCLSNGARGEICGLSGPNRCRLAEMGFTKGCEVEVARESAFGGPIEIRLRSYRVSLRVEEANGITVKTVTE